MRGGWAELGLPSGHHWQHLTPASNVDLPPPPRDHRGPSVRPNLRSRRRLGHHHEPGPAGRRQLTWNGELIRVVVADQPAAAPPPRRAVSAGAVRKLGRRLGRPLAVARCCGWRRRGSLGVCCGGWAGLAGSLAPQRSPFSPSLQHRPSRLRRQWPASAATPSPRRRLCIRAAAAQPGSGPPELDYSVAGLPSYSQTA